MDPQSDEIKIRPVVVTDSFDIKKYLFTQACEEEIRNNICVDIQEMQRGTLLRIVAEVNKKIIGQCDFRRSSSPTKQHIADITGLVVNPDYQGKRISSMLMEYGVKWAKEKGIEIITVSVRKGTKAEDIYLHKGFKIYGHLENGIKEPWESKKQYDEIFFAKKI